VIHDRKERLMALDNGEGGGDYLDRDWWLDRGREGVLAVFRINRVEPPVKLRADLKEAEPVNVDFVILNGSEEGTVYRSERVIAAGIVNTLRTKTVERDGKRVKVERQKGDDVAVRLGTFKAFGKDHPGANPCGPDEFEKVKKVFADTAGDPYSYYEKRAMAGVDNGDSGQPDDDDGLPF
jgi:hypothetical protein